MKRLLGGIALLVGSIVLLLFVLTGQWPRPTETVLEVHSGPVGSPVYETGGGAPRP